MASGDDTKYSRSGYPMNQLWANLLMAVGVLPSEFEPLNRTSNTFFSPGKSGYGANRFWGGVERPKRYSGKFKGHNMSTWLPLLKA